MNSVRHASLVVPVFNEELNISILAREIEGALSKINVEWECIWVDDNSSDGSLKELLKLQSPHKILSLSQNLGQSTAIMAGIDHSKFEVIVTLDGDLQNDPRDIPRLIEAFENVDVVCGYRVDRQDSRIWRLIPSKMANFIARKVTGIKVTDLGCTLRIFRKDLVSNQRILGEMHRVIVIYFANAGARITEISTNHRPRIHGKSKYGIERTLKFIADLFLAKVTKVLMTRPLYFFGFIALLFFLTSLALFIIGVMFYDQISNNTKALVFLSSSAILLMQTIIISAIGLLFEVNMKYAVGNNRSIQYTLKKI
jgi:glycosyltransferase involved in cell wall biosynthesis